jgi:hypothetical protein
MIDLEAQSIGEQAEIYGQAARPALTGSGLAGEAIVARPAQLAVAPCR